LTIRENPKVISQIIIQSNHLAKNQETNGSDYLSLPLLILKRLKNIWKPTILKNNGITAPSDIHTELIRLKTLANEEKRISFGDIPTAIQISRFKRTLVPNKALDQKTLKD
jgi:hypothetical protein